MASSDSQIDKPQRECPKRAELPDVNINKGANYFVLDRQNDIPCIPRDIQSTAVWGRYFSNHNYKVGQIYLNKPENKNYATPLSLFPTPTLMEQLSNKASNGF